MIDNLRFRRQVEHLHRLGPRATAELLAEIGVERDSKLAAYTGIEPEALEAAGGDKFWLVPIHVVRS